jgi:hypothetical protein
LNEQTTMFIVLSSVVLCSFLIIGRLFSETLRIESLQLVCISARAETDMRKRKSRISSKRPTANFHCLSSVGVLQFPNYRESLFSQTSTIRSFAALYALSLSLQFKLFCSLYLAWSKLGILGQWKEAAFSWVGFCKFEMFLLSSCNFPFNHSC